MYSLRLINLEVAQLFPQDTELYSYIVRKKKGPYTFTKGVATRQKQSED